MRLINKLLLTEVNKKKLETLKLSKIIADY